MVEGLEVEPLIAWDWDDDLEANDRFVRLGEERMRLGWLVDI